MLKDVPVFINLLSTKYMGRSSSKHVFKTQVLISNFENEEIDNEN